MADIDEDTMRPLFEVGADEVVGKKAFSAAGGSKDKFIPVGAYSFTHRFVGNIDGDRQSARSITQADTKRAEGGSVIGFQVEKAGGLLSKRVKKFFSG